MFHSAFGLHLVRNCDGGVLPHGWTSVPNASCPVWPISSDVSLARDLPAGSYALLVDSNGDFITDKFSELQTSITMVSANALQVLAWQFKTQLLTLLSSPAKQHLAPMLDQVVQLYETDLQLEQDAVSELSAEEKGLESCSIVSQCNSQASSSSQASSNINALKNASFDRIVAACYWFVKNKERIDFEGLEGHDNDPFAGDDWAAASDIMKQQEGMLEVALKDKPPSALSAKQIIEQLEELLDDVFQAEQEILGVDVSSRTGASQLVPEWAAAHDLRQLRNEYGAHPLNNAATAMSVAQLFEEVASEPHPSLRKLPHLAKLPALAAKAHAAKLEAKVQQRRAARGKLIFKLRCNSKAS